MFCEPSIQPIQIETAQTANIPLEFQGFIAQESSPEFKLERARVMHRGELMLLLDGKGTGHIKLERSINNKAVLITNNMMKDLANFSDKNFAKRAEIRLQYAITIETAAIRITQEYNQNANNNGTAMVVYADVHRILIEQINLLTDIETFKRMPIPTHVTNGSYLTPKRLALNPK